MRQKSISLQKAKVIISRLWPWQGIRLVMSSVSFLCAPSNDLKSGPKWLSLFMVLPNSQEISYVTKVCIGRGPSSDREDESSEHSSARGMGRSSRPRKTRTPQLQAPAGHPR